ncbi:hypothetical protein TcasGA2_TC033989 [Tribolium castaneum]|uniref:Uncharacterized protein n=1 Tax=Tribolium castaneum TaxID=7070 RepID=A0A139WE52_TRICA|nr:PREDICTED: uncharacterized protein LOC103313863 [Tribolium castaneum]KYB26135.1 hypothetical protein TcasGA2_TC033989 [Tribolium castaneum]|eukprot:XP_008196462.1 PREDICTED: uncharacterized protein LOC103313863 [Tribolium castaneum]
MMALIVALIYLTLTKNVLALTCYSSNITNLKSALLGQTPNIQLELDCLEYINQVQRSQNNSAPTEQIPENDLHCFSLFVHKDFGEVVLKGCFLRNGCVVLKSKYAKLSQFPVKCVECEGNNCNGASRETFGGIFVILSLIFNHSFVF